MKEFSYFIEEKFNNYKMIDFLKSIGYSNEIIQKIKFGGISVNEKISTNVNDRVKTNDQVKIIFPDDELNLYAPAVKGDLKVIYEDDYFIAVIKEKGILTHSSKSNSNISLEQLFYGYIAPLKLKFRAINRLDRDTSGIILIAKDMLSASLLSNQMKDGLIKKTYSALLLGVPKQNHFFINENILRESPSSMKRVCDKNGKTAITECLSIKDLNNGLSLAEIYLHTGRTHQIRVHFSHIGFPLYADSLYGKKVDGKTYTLHAKRLEFTHPFTKKKIILNSEVDI